MFHSITLVTINVVMASVVLYAMIQTYGGLTTFFLLVAVPALLVGYVAYKFRQKF